jgi:hypothetical protein
LFLKDTPFNVIHKDPIRLKQQHGCLYAAVAWAPPVLLHTVRTRISPGPFVPSEINGFRPVRHFDIKKKKKENEVLPSPPPPPLSSCFKIGHGRGEEIY